MNKKITLSSIKALDPCKDRLDNFIEHYPEFKGTLEEFFELNHITIHDKLWLGLRLLSRTNIEVFAIDCAATAASYATASAYAAAEASYAAAEASYATSASVATAASYTAAEASYAASVASADDVAAYTAAADEKKRQLDAILYLYNLEAGNE